MRASAAGFGWIVWAYQSATRERPLINRRLGVSKQCAFFFSFLLPLSLRKSFCHLRSHPSAAGPCETSPATMTKGKTSALERVKKAVTQGKGKRSARGRSSSRSALPKGWIQGDWMPSVIRQEDLDDMVEGGVIPHDVASSSGERDRTSTPRW